MINLEFNKTSAYIELIKQNPNRKFLVALPTNSLKEQVYNDLTKKIGEQAIYMTSSVHGNAFIQKETREEIAVAHQNGFHKKAKNIIKELYQETEESEPEAKAKIIKIEWEMILFHERKALT